MTGENAVFADGIFARQGGDQLVGQEGEKLVGRAGGELGPCECGHQVAPTIGIHHAGDDHGRQASVPYQVVDDDRHLGERPFAVEHDEKGQAGFHLRRRRHENRALLAEDFRLHHFLFADGEVEVLRSGVLPGDSENKKCE